MSQRIVKWLAASAILAAAGTAMGDTFNVTAPVITATNAEILGPRSQFTFTVVNTGTAPDLGNAVTVDSVMLIGLDASGNPVTSPVNASYTLTGAEITLPTTNADGSINATTVDLSATTNDDFVFTAPGVVSVMVRVTEGATNVDAAFNANDESVDECFAVDFTPPTITSIFRQSGTDNAFFVVFSESLSLNGIGSNVTANQTDPTMVTEADFQVSTAMVFGALDDALSDQTFLSNNTVLRFDIAVAGADDLGVGSILRSIGGTMDIRDAVGNIIGGGVNPGGSVTTATPPAFTVTRAEWRQTNSGGGATDGFAAVFSTPIATAGDNAFYNGNDSLTRSGVDSDLFFVGAPIVDPSNPNAVLVDLGCCTDDEVFADGRDFQGAMYAWNFASGFGTAPTDIFGSTLTTPPATPLTVLDEITPTQQFISFHDINRDGRIDAIGFGFDEPVTTNASATTFTLRKANGTVQPVQQITALGALVDDTVVADGMAANNVITISSVSVGDIRLFGGPSRLETGNGILLNFDPNLVNWDNDPATAVGSAMEAIPGTGGAGGGACAVTVESTTGFTATDASSNSTTPAPFAALPTTADRARPDLVFAYFFTGDNQTETIGGNANDQLFGENDGTTGDSIASNRVAFVFSENLNGEENGDNENQFRFGPGGVFGFGDDGFVFDSCLFCGSFVAQNPDNVLTLRNSQAQSPALVTGVAVSILPQSGVTDPSGNEVLESDTATVNRVAPYMPLVTDVNGSQVFAAFMFDADADGFADSVRITMNQPIDAATVAVSDFTLSLGTITAVAVQGNDIVLTVTDGVVPMTSNITGTYNGAADAMRIASLTTGGGTGVAVAATNFSFGIQRIAPPDEATRELAFMDIIVNVTLDGTTPVPPGTKVYAMTAAPHIHRVTATHNNVAFTQNVLTDRSSMRAWNDWLFGTREFVYLGRDLDNYQYYDNDKDLGDSNDGISTYKDVINLTINASNLTNITFTGTGETSGDKVTNGRCFLAWDVLRASGGDINEFNDVFSGNRAFGGQPLLSSAVITGTDGRCELHHSAPASIFNGRSRLSAVGRPVIMVVELPDGQRFPISGVHASIQGAPILFNIQNRSQTAGLANNATVVNANLRNVGAQQLHRGWNLLPFPRNSGWAATTGARPVRPDGVTEAAIVVPSASNPALPFAGPLEQFVWFGDDNGDGKWTRSDDFNFEDIIIDLDWLNYFAFTMSSLGVQAGSAMNNFVGGYAMGIFFTDEIWNSFGFSWDSIGCFQFGAPLTGNTLFAGTTAANSFPNNATTQGWGLFTSKAAFNPATAIRSTNNPKLDYLFIFRNNGPNAASLNRTTIEVSSLDLLAPTGNDNINDTTQVDAGQAFFGHWQP
ncbi:MAG: hypothetical protein JNK58_04255 [Phycisphaerae bacterium]|nr:hypothetical protein [Phycisphaerae bacterium]